ncbi:isoleucine--tRNA ligase [Candidatus Woesearchaeota archaeon]|nr:isoleucine--tRNA ligase [Candidatus Woesearchaeota archaeon]
MYDFKKVEEETAKIWKKNKKEIKKSLQYNPKRKLYSFLEGPPTANAPPGLHHVEVRVFKDLFCRFKYMQGYTVPRKGGWDCHGLPVEVQVEKALKLNSKKEILNYGIKKFNKECNDSVFSYINEWNKLTDKMAFWVDLDNPYITLDNKYMESVWWSLKELYNKKMLYEGYKVVPLCPRCETPLSSHEVALGYKKISEPAIYVKFRVENTKNRYFLAFTTTPWTLPSNLALGLDKNLIYAVVKHENEEYILLKNLVNKFFKNPKIIEEFKGEKVKNLRYKPLFPYFKDLKNSFRVLLVDFVSSEEGTGIIHLAPAFGEDDYESCKSNKIGFVKPVNENGRFTEEVHDFKGLFVKDADPKIIDHLDKNKHLFKKENYEHDYPFCWRCDTPLIYYAMVSWFIKVSSIREQLIINNNNINWVPKHIKEGRFGNWLEGAKDWALSRKKFWGTPLPIWRCNECKNEIIIGSISELKEKSNTKKEIDLHKPGIDEIKIKCNKCNSLMSRIPDVIDCWYDSGAAPFAQYHYPFENKEIFNKSFPYDFIAEAIDQTRGWFYTLHVLGTILFGKNAYKNVVCAGHVVDENGEKMSKTRGNIINPWEMFNTVGVDATRLQFCVNEPGDQKRFSLNSVNQKVMPFLNILWNCYQYSNDFRSTNKPKLQIEDHWIISKTNNLINNVTEELEKHNYHKCLDLFIEFVNEDLSRTYIKLIRDREDEQTIGYVFSYVFDRLSRLLGPFAPYISDYLYNNKNSVHLGEWPSADKKMINKDIEFNIVNTKEIIQGALNERNNKQIGVRWPLSKLIVYTEDDSIVKSIKQTSSLIQSQVNVKEIKIEKERAQNKFRLELDTQLTPELEQEGFARELTRRIQSLRKKIGLKKQDKVILGLKTDYNLGKFLKEIKKKVGAKEISFDKITKNSSKESIKGKEFLISVSKL